MKLFAKIFTPWRKHHVDANEDNAPPPKAIKSKYISKGLKIEGKTPKVTQSKKEKAELLKKEEGFLFFDPKRQMYHRGQTIDEIPYADQHNNDNKIGYIIK
jgi:hypothetical protein